MGWRRQSGKVEKGIRNQSGRKIERDEQEIAFVRVSMGNIVLHLVSLLYESFSINRLRLDDL